MVMKAKAASSIIKYKCNFKNGVCSMVRKLLKSSGSLEHSPLLNNGHCCCSICAEKFGYLKTFYNKYAKIYADAWNDITGFFDEQLIELHISTGAKNEMSTH